MSTPTLEQARALIAALVQRFERNLKSYQDPSYNEAQLRKEFLDPFFEAFGWDVANKQGYAPQYREVVDEETLRAGDTARAPDYSFRIGGTRKFFVEAKKPAVGIKDNADAAFQLRRYAWSAKLPLSILTDFEELAVYEARKKPSQTDKASVERVNYMTYRDYAERLEEIWNVFSKEAVLKGDFDRFAGDVRKKRGTAEVDGEFLKEIEEWRDELARNFALRNPRLTVHELNHAVQATIDRILFLRIAEDRGAEKYGRLQALQNGERIYRRLTELYEQADAKYNAGLFDFGPAGDRLTLNLTIDDKVLKGIIGGLYYPDCPYEFSVLSADILGSVYERFLGKVIRLTKGHQAKVEDKPEVKKAGGVYYTPAYIVEYIVANTVGELIKGKSPGQIEKLKILDPACGSGSFLLGAYQKLLDYHLDWYTSHNPEKRPKSVQKFTTDAQGIPVYRLTTAEKKRIALNNIFGVDIDPQAVEVAKLNLLLKVMEGETEETIRQTMVLFQERALPNLDNNIKCGNSLIGPDYWAGKLIIDDDERRRINAFDWNAEFSKIMRAGGFDAVIGNPPYLSIDDTWGRGDPRQRYLKTAYSDVYNDKTDILFYFLTKAVTLARGKVSFIVSRAFLEAYKADKLRQWLAEHVRITEILDFRNHYVFTGVGITTAVVALTHGKPTGSVTVYQLRGDDFAPDVLAIQKETPALFRKVATKQSNLGPKPWVFADRKIETINQKVDSAGEPLGDILSVGQGMQTGCNRVFSGIGGAQARRWMLKQGECFVRARNSDIQRYHIRQSELLVLYLEDVKRFGDLSSELQAHLKAHEAELKKRAAYQRGDCEWWRFTWPLHKDHLLRPKLLCPYLAPVSRFALDEEQRFIGLTDTTVLYDAGQAESLKYILGLLNSRLLTARFKYIGKLKSGGIMEYFWNSISKLPIRRIDFELPADKSRHDRMVDLVDRMLKLHEKLDGVRTKRDRELIQRQLDATDKEIDQLVYELYGLTSEEIALVERES